MTNLHNKYLRENSGSNMGYTLFCKFRPFWVVKPGLTDRQTCKKHANLQFKADRLHQLGVLSEKNIGTLVEGLACDRQRKRCMFNECPTCCSNVPKYVALDQDPNTHVIWWWEWVLKKEQKPGHTGENIECKVTQKDKVPGTLQQLESQFTTEVQQFRKHVFNIRHHYHVQHELRLRCQTTSNECVLHIDFSEYYSCGYSSEIQSVHIGASHNQATLHTGILYVDQDRSYHTKEEFLIVLRVVVPGTFQRQDMARVQRMGLEVS